MEDLGISSIGDPYSGSSSTSNGISGRFRRLRTLVASLGFFQSPLSVILEYSGILSSSDEDEDEIGVIVPNYSAGGEVNAGDEIAIRIIGESEEEQQNVDDTSESIVQIGGVRTSEGGRAPLLFPSTSSSSVDENVDIGDGNGRDSSHRRYSMQQLGRRIEQILPFSLLLLVVFIRQHLQGFFFTLWVAAIMFKSNDILRKQTALKDERKTSILIGLSVVFMLHVASVYWWFQNDCLLYPLVMLPPKSIPPFWHIVFIILVNDIMARQAAMAFKCLLLIYYKNGKGHSFRRQGQMLTLVEYALLLYRALLPAPVWYRFFLNKDYGSLFSSLVTGLYLTFKLTSVVEKVRSLIGALKALSQKEVHYGTYATPEQVIAAGDLCAICQESMHAPILLQCKHIFCEDCVSEWFERERTCPLCRAVIRSADLRSFGDGSTSLCFQLF